ncbi:hypothetical protein BYT27DRAFT_7264790 [Phlegmacium glaucopus]|nr:hypothetical protein BYT27DRAFT_7264790 [Phlegmacium glaucopus]
MSILGGTFFLLTFVPYSQTQIIDTQQNPVGTIVAGCIVGGLFVLLFLILFVLLLRRRRSQMVVNGRISRQENKPLFDGSWGWRQPVQQSAVPTTPYRPQGLAETSSVNPPPVQHDLVLSDTDQFPPGVPPPAYTNDPNMKSVYFASPGNGTEDPNTGGISCNPPPFPSAAHVNGQENVFVGGFRR